MANTTVTTGITTEMLEKIGFVVIDHDTSKFGTSRFGAEVMERSAEVLSYLANSNGDIIVHDDHNGGGETRNLSAVLVLGTGEVCESFTHGAHCLNPLYIDSEDNNLHLSTWSCAGNVYASRSLDFSDVVKNYNSELDRSTLNFVKVKKIIAYKTF